MPSHRLTQDNVIGIFTFQQFSFFLDNNDKSINRLVI